MMDGNEVWKRNRSPLPGLLDAAKYALAAQLEDLSGAEDEFTVTNSASLSHNGEGQLRLTLTLELVPEPQLEVLEGGASAGARSQHHMGRAG